MTNANSELPESRTLALRQTSNERLDLERKVLAAAFKISFDAGESDGAALAHKGLCAIIQQQLFSGDSSGSSGSVIPASIWNQPDTSDTVADHPPPAQTPPVQEPAAPPESTHVTAEVPIPQPQPQFQTLDSIPAPQDVGQGPASYLDLGGPEDTALEGEPSAAAVAEMVALSSAEPPAEQVPLTPSQLIKKQSFYQILAVNKLSSFEEIHTRFLRVIRRMLRSRYAAEGAIRDMREFREVLRAICVAHDVLKDPVTRADYDLRQLGMRNTDQIETPADAQPPRGSRTRLMIGELLECSNILEPAELQAALDMHRAEPGQQFGEFLVRAGFLTQEELDSALLGQRLISAGKITVAQFQTAMYRMRDCGAAFFDTLMVEGWITPRDIFDESSVLWETPPVSIENAPPTVAPNTTPLERGFDPTLIAAAELGILDDHEHNGHTHNGGHSAPEAAAVAAARKTLELDEKWSDKDACAETQSMDVAALRAAINSVEDQKD